MMPGAIFVFLFAVPVAGGLEADLHHRESGSLIDCYADGILQAHIHNLPEIRCDAMTRDQIDKLLAAAADPEGRAT